MQIYMKWQTELDKIDINEIIGQVFALNFADKVNFIKKKEKVMYEQEQVGNLKNPNNEQLLFRMYDVPTEKEFRNDVVSYIGSLLRTAAPKMVISPEYIEKYVEEKTHFPTQVEIDNYYYS